MQYTIPHYYKQFRCIADKCPDTCCAGWQIMIDNRSLKKYSKVKGGFGNRLQNGIDWKVHAFLQQGGRCEFLNEDNLCDIYKECGANMLCRTCQNYPRHTEEFEGLREISLSLSCPEAARIILGEKEPVRFLTKEDSREETYEYFDFFLFTKLSDTRELIFQILQDRNLQISVRMAIVAALAHDIQIRINKNSLFEIDDILDRYRSDRMIPFFETALKSYSNREKERYKILQQMGAVLDELEVLRPEWQVLLKGIRNELYQNGVEHYLRSRAEFLSTFESLEVYSEQLMIFWCFTYFCGAVYDEAAESKMKLALFSTIFILELAHGMWLKQGKQLSFDDFTDLAHRYAREIEHSDPNLNRLDQVFQENNIYHLEQFLLCIMN